MVTPLKKANEAIPLPKQDSLRPRLHWKKQLLERYHSQLKEEAAEQIRNLGKDKADLPSEEAPRRSIRLVIKHSKLE